jgi:type IV secretion system protein VirB9
MNIKTLAIAGLMAALLATAMPHSAAYAITEPRKGTADARVKTLTYRENDVFELKGHYGFTTMVELSPKEHIETTSIGDSEAWQVIPSTQRSNILFVKPLEPNAETNMTVLTDKRIYAFELSASIASSYKSDDLAFRVRFIYPEDAQEIQQKKKPSLKDYDPQEGADTSDWNFDYAYSGARRLRPEQAFDDGTFTYLKFGKQDITPAIFVVDESGHESLINFNIQGQYLVIERVGRQFTLRDGDIATCIFNEAYAQESGTQGQKTALKTPLKTTGKSKASKTDTPVPPKKPLKAALTETSTTVEEPNEQRGSLWDALGARDPNSSRAGFNN